MALSFDSFNEPTVLKYECRSPVATCVASSTFSSTVISWKRLVTWKVRPSPSPTLSWMGKCVMSLPFRRTEPDVTG